MLYTLHIVLSTKQIQQLEHFMRIFCFCAKGVTVQSGPMIRGNEGMNHIMASVYAKRRKKRKKKKQKRPLTITVSTNNYYYYHFIITSH